MNKDAAGKIPKIIHYVWFGGKKLPIVEKCIESWKKNCPNFEIVEWNEKNFDVNSHPFVKEAIEKKKWAFAADYIRIFALYNFGGVYLDTDMEIFEDLSPLLENGAFFASENKWVVGSAIIGCVKGHPLIKQFLDYYDNRRFIKKNGSLDTQPNTYIMTTILKYDNHIHPKGKFLQWKDVKFLQPETFYPKDYFSGQTNITKNTLGFHHFDSSWQDEKEKKKMFDTSWDEGTSNKKKVHLVSFKNFFRGLANRMLYVRLHWKMKRFRKKQKSHRA